MSKGGIEKRKRKTVLKRFHSGTLLLDLDVQEFIKYKAIFQSRLKCALDYVLLHSHWPLVPIINVFDFLLWIPEIILSRVHLACFSFF